MASLPESATSEKLKLQEIDPKECTNSERLLAYDRFKSRLDQFQQQAALNYPSLTGISAARELGDRATFLALFTPFYPTELARFPAELLSFLESSARILPSGFRLRLTQALTFLIDRKMIDIADTLQVLMELQTLGDGLLQQLAYINVVRSISSINQNHKNNPKKMALRNILFEMLKQKDEAKAERALLTLCDLHRKKIWSDVRASNAICMACFHPSSRIMVAALSFLLDFEKIEDDDGDDSDRQADQATPQPKVVLNKEAMHKACCKLQQQQCLSSEKSNGVYSSPLNHLKDAKGFSYMLLSLLESRSNEKFEVKSMILKVIARTIGLHHLILFDFYMYLQYYIEPHKRDVTDLLGAAVEACHKKVPSGAVQPLFDQIVSQFVDDRSWPEYNTVGLNVVREMCLRVPLLMTEELRRSLVIYRKSHEKAVSASACLLRTLKDEEKKRKLSDLDAANMSFGDLKKLKQEARNAELSPHTIENRGIRALEDNQVYDSTTLRRPDFRKGRIPTNWITRKEFLAYKRRGYNIDISTSCCERMRESREKEKEGKKPMRPAAKEAKTTKEHKKFIKYTARRAKRSRSRREKKRKKRK